MRQQIVTFWLLFLGLVNPPFVQALASGAREEGPFEVVWENAMDDSLDSPPHSQDVEMKSEEENTAIKRDAEETDDLNLTEMEEMERQQRAPMRFGKRAPMRFGKREPMRFGKREPMRFGKREPMRFGKREPMRFGKRAPMRFGKREQIGEEDEDDEMNYPRYPRAPMRFGKRAPMRFGKREPMRFGKRSSSFFNFLGEDTPVFNRPMRFGKRAPMRFGKREPMRFGKREPMRFGKRAPMRFGKRSEDFSMEEEDPRLYYLDLDLDDGSLDMEDLERYL